MSYYFKTISANIWTDDSLIRGLPDDRRYWLWGYITDLENRGRLTTEEANELRLNLWWVKRVPARHW